MPVVTASIDQLSFLEDRGHLNVLIRDAGAGEGMFGAGSAASPLDVNRAVQSATAAAMRAVQVIHKTASTEAA